jgi:trehalose-phosphatase
LDFDGTLTRIAATPDKCFLPEAVKKSLRKIAGNAAVQLAFISGRRLKDLKTRVGIKKVIYSGNHGLEVEGPGIAFKPFIVPGYQRIVTGIKRELARKAATIPGVWVEDKGLTISLHYRLAAKPDVPAVKKMFRETVGPYLSVNALKVKSGKMVVEVMPPVEWDKGKVVRWLWSQRFSAAQRKAGVPLYVGDDITDEDAFRAIAANGVTVFCRAAEKIPGAVLCKDPGRSAKVSG